MRRAWTVGVGAGIVLVLGISLWFRIADLANIPGINGDEAWYGVQVTESLARRPFALRTPTGLPLNPFHFGPEWLLLTLFEPAFWILRAPAVLSGVLAVVLTYVLGSKCLDRPTATVAALLLASLPISIAYSRFGWDASQTPLVSFVAVYFSIRKNLPALLVTAVACLVVHASNIFLAPLLLAPYVVGRYRSLRKPKDRRRLVVTVLIVSVTPFVVIPAVSSRPLLLLLDSTQWLLYLARYGRLLSGVTSYQYLAGPLSPGVLRFHDVVFWATFLAVMLPGSVVLLRRRQWDRIALIAGSSVGIMGFYVVAGPDALAPGWERYGMFMVVPSILVFSSALCALLSQDAAIPEARRSAILSSCLLICVTLLFTFHRLYFEAIRSTGGRAHVTFRTAAVEPKQQALALILADIAARPKSDRVRVRRVLADGWWLYWPLRYLASREEAVEVVRYDQVATDPEKRRHEMQAQLQAGAYIVGFAGEEADLALRKSGLDNALRTWIVEDYSGGSLISISRLR